MKVLVTGGAGYVGSIVVAHLIKQGYQVTVLDKCFFGAESVLPFYNRQCNFISGDICDHNLAGSAMQGVDAIVHLAAVVGENACDLNEKATRTINLHGTEQLLSLAQQFGVKRFLFISTCSNYGVSPSESLAKEETPLNPLTLYAKTKVLAEQKVLEPNNSMTKTVLRFGTICGLSPRMRFDLLVNDMARAVACNQPIQIFSPQAWRPFLHIQDSADVIDHCLKAPQHKINCKVYNVISENYQKKDLIDLTLKHFPDKKIEIVKKDIDPRDYCVSAERIKREIEFTPGYTIEQAYLEVFNAVKQGVFKNPLWPGYSSIPEDKYLKDIFYLESLNL